MIARLSVGAAAPSIGLPAGPEPESPTVADEAFAHMLAAGLPVVSGGQPHSGGPPPLQIEVAGQSLTAERFNEQGFFGTSYADRGRDGAPAVPEERGVPSRAVATVAPSDALRPSPVAHAAVSLPVPEGPGKIPIALREDAPASGRSAAAGNAMKPVVHRPLKPQQAQAATLRPVMPEPQRASRPAASVETRESLGVVAARTLRRAIARGSAEGTSTLLHISVRGVEQGIRVAVAVSALGAEERARLHDEIAALLSRHGYVARGIHLTAPAMGAGGSKGR